MRKLLVLALEVIILVAELLEERLVMPATGDDERRLHAFDLLLQLLHTRQTLVSLPLGDDEVIPHVAKILLQGVDAQALVLFVVEESLDLALSVDELRAHGVASSVLGWGATAIGTP